MRCGGIQNESRPISTCHWMSHWTPQPAMTLEARRAHRTARLRASVSTGAWAASNGRSVARTLTSVAYFVAGFAGGSTETTLISKKSVLPANGWLRSSTTVVSLTAFTVTGRGWPS